MRSDILSGWTGPPSPGWTVPIIRPLACRTASTAGPSFPTDGFGNGTCSSGIRASTTPRTCRPWRSGVAGARLCREDAIRTIPVDVGRCRERCAAYHLLVDGSRWRKRTRPPAASAAGQREPQLDRFSGRRPWQRLVPLGRLELHRQAERAPAISILGPPNGSVVNNTTVELRWNGSDFDNDNLVYAFNITDERVRLHGEFVLLIQDTATGGREEVLWNVTVSTASTPLFRHILFTVRRTTVRHTLAPAADRAGRNVYTYQVRPSIPMGTRWTSRWPGALPDDGRRRRKGGVEAERLAGRQVFHGGACGKRRRPGGQAGVRAPVLPPEQTSIEGPSPLWMVLAVAIIVLAATILWMRRSKDPGSG